MIQTKKIFLYLSIILSGSACTKDFQKLNASHNKPSSTTIAPLMNGVLGSLFLGGTEQASVHTDYYYPSTQLGAITSASGYILVSGAAEIWGGYYSNLQNMNLVQQKINEAVDKESMNNIQAVLNIVKAYKTFRVTDQFGDIPYFKAGQAFTGDVDKFRVAYDPQQLIYDSLLSDLKWAVTNMNVNANAVTSAGTPYETLGTFDALYKGDMTKWKKFANALRLRYAMQMVEKDPATATPIIADVMVSSDIVDEGNDVAMWPAAFAYQLWVRWWAISSGGAGFSRISSTMWNMVADDTTDAKIFDPRAKLFADKNAAGKWAPDTIGVSKGDGINGYFSGTDPNDRNGTLYSTFNWYLMRDEWYIPELIFTAAEVHFLKAEAYARGLGVTANLATAETEYKAGIASSVNFWYNIASKTNNVSDAWAAVAPPAPTDSDMAKLYANAKVKFTGSADDAVTKIYAQEWLSFYREPWLAFNLWRRTGKTPMDPNSNPPTATKTFYRLPYAQDEAVNNTENYNAQLAKMGSNNSDVKVWWMP